MAEDRRTPNASAVGARLQYIVRSSQHPRAGESQTRFGTIDAATGVSLERIREAVAGAVGEAVWGVDELQAVLGLDWWQPFGRFSRDRLGPCNRQRGARSLDFPLEP